jgi:hypothetical protein
MIKAMILAVQLHAIPLHTAERIIDPVLPPKYQSHQSLGDTRTRRPYPEDKRDFLLEQEIAETGEQSGIMFAIRIHCHNCRSTGFFRGGTTVLKTGFVSQASVMSYENSTCSFRERTCSVCRTVIDDNDRAKGPSALNYGANRCHFVLGRYHDN